jgi:hypothetical protein
MPENRVRGQTRSPEMRVLQDGPDPRLIALPSENRPHFSRCGGAERAPP